MSFPNDEHLNEFRIQSDKAFLTMQASADKEMQKFLKSYSENATMASFQTPDMSWGVAPVPAIAAVTSTLRRKVKKAVEAGGRAVDKAANRAKGHAAHGAFNNFGDLGDAVQDDLEHTAKEAVAETKSWLKSAGMDLGERAKREAQAMRDAARKAMQEETSLKGLKERAQAELEAAKQRMKAELNDVKADAVADLEGIAIDKLGDAQEHGFKAAEAAQRQAQLELEDLLGGGGHKKKG